MKIINILIMIFIVTNNAFAITKQQLPIPRYVSIKSGEANIRSGPNVRYPINWVFVKKNEPVEIIYEFEQWRKIRDISGDEGWIHESMLSGKRFGIIMGASNQTIPTYKKSSINSEVVFRIEPKTRVILNACHNDWCLVNIDNLKGWVQRKNLWGVYKNEEFD